MYIFHGKHTKTLSAMGAGRLQKEVALLRVKLLVDGTDFGRPGTAISTVGFYQMSWNIPSWCPKSCSFWIDFQRPALHLLQRWPFQMDLDRGDGSKFKLSGTTELSVCLVWTIRLSGYPILTYTILYPNKLQQYKQYSYPQNWPKYPYNWCKHQNNARRMLNAFWTVAIGRVCSTWKACSSPTS